MKVAEVFMNANSTAPVSSGFTGENSPLSRRHKLSHSERITRTLLELFSSFPKSGLLLDAPAGNGGTSCVLQEMGFKTISLDLFSSPSMGPKMPCVKADLNQQLPFRNSSFEYVVSQEGIEHLENQAQFIRECGRILKEAGKLIISTPNALHLTSRLAYLLIGQRHLKGGVINEVQTPIRAENGRIYHGHAFVIDYFRLRYLLRIAGFRILRIHATRRSKSSVMLSFLVPFIFCATHLSIHHRLKNDTKKGQASDRNIVKQIIREILSAPLLYGNMIVVEAVKTELPYHMSN